MQIFKIFSEVSEVSEVFFFTTSTLQYKKRYTKIKKKLYFTIITV